MVPTVTQQLESLKLTLERVVMPALPDGATFAKEQAGLVWATLGWLIDVHESEVPYELAEAADYRSLLQALVDMPAASESPVRGPASAVLAETPAGAADGLVALRDQLRRMKRAALDLAAAIGPEHRAEARRLTLDVARRQAEREAAWYRMTGFTQCPAPGGVAEVLAPAS